MKKVALLVEFTPRTRIVVEIPEDQTIDEWLENDENFGKVSELAREKMCSDIQNYLYGDNMSCEEDAECPFGTFEEDEDKLPECPYCFSKNTEITARGTYHCKDCDWLFNEEDIERQELRHQISPLLNGTSEEEPLEIFFNLPSAEEEACGLSSLEIPAIEKIFELEGEGTMWYYIRGERDLSSGELIWHDLDELEIGDLRELLDYLREILN